MRGAGVKEISRCLRRDPSSYLHPSGKCEKRFRCLLKVLFVSLIFYRIEKDDVTSR